MRLLFLGTGGAWGLPEHQCPCATCRHMRQIGEHRTRTSLWVEGPAKVLIDPGPDLRAQLMREDLPRPDAVLITHEHGDHYLGLDELLCYRRNAPRQDWRPIPVWATAQAWEAIEPRFGYLMNGAGPLGSLLTKRVCQPGQEIAEEPFGPGFTARPIKTDHGPMPKGAVGYVLAEQGPGGARRLGYTSDMVRCLEPQGFAGLDLLVCQSHFVSEPVENRANHLSLQRALPLLERWRPGRVFFVHLSCQDFIDGDGLANHMLKKYPPAQPLAGPAGPYAVPRDQAQWDSLIAQALADHGLGHIPASAAYDGLSVMV